MKIQLPIDTSAVSFIDVMPPEPVLDRLTKQPKADANGEPLYSIELRCIPEKGGEVLQAKFPGTPSAGGPPGLPGRGTGPRGRARGAGRRPPRAVSRAQEDAGA